METKFDDGREQIFDKPEFMPPEAAVSTRVMTGYDGSHWLIFQKEYSWAIRPASARLSTFGDALEISIRLKWSDDDANIPSGEVRVCNIHALKELADVAEYLHHGPLDTYAIALSFKPPRFRIT